VDIVELRSMAPGNECYVRGLHCNCDGLMGLKLAKHSAFFVREGTRYGTTAGELVVLESSFPSLQ